VTVSDHRGRPVRAPGLASWLRRVAPASARGAVNVALVSDSRIKALNRAYRGTDRVTDVLSFPSQTSIRNSQSAIPNPQSAIPHHLGDIAIARGVARRQARQAGHPHTAELRVLALHGLLHLLGYDHERDNGEMHRLEQRLRAKGGLRAGLIERARP
jgi:probable rRNA maturation factor